MKENGLLLYRVSKIIITPIQPTKSRSLFELINLIQIKESVVVILPIFSVVFTYFIFSYAFHMFSSRENQGYYIMSSMSVLIREWLILN